MTDPSEELFLRDVAEHQMIVLRDDGLYRHIRFKQPGTMSMYFDLITWPGRLCYTGDMGTYVFQRLEDMFQFFRVDREYAVSRNKRLYINLGYWTEKLVAVDGGRFGGKSMEFSKEKFRTVINEYRVRWMRDAKERDLLDKDQRRDLWEAVESEVLDVMDDDDGTRTECAAYDFHHENRLSGRTWHFEDLFEHNFKEYTFHMVWCCYALAWGIQQYDDAKAPSTASGSEGLKP
jgi:hypothetical protein